MSAAYITLLQNKTTDGTDGFVRWQRSTGGAMITAVGEVNVTGTFDGAAVGFVKKINGVEVAIHNSAGAVAITDSVQAFRLALIHGEEIKAVVSGAGASTDIICTITELRAL